MELVKNLKISHKLQVLIALSALFLIIASIVGYGYIQSGQKKIQQMYNDRLIPVKELMLARVNLNASKANIYDMITTTDYRKKIELKNNIESRLTESDKIFKDYEQRKLDTFELSTLDELKNLLSEYRPLRGQTMQLAMEGKNAQALSVFRNADNKFGNIVKTIEKLTDYSAEKADNLNTQSQKDAVTANIILLIVGLGSLTLLIVLGTMISNMITRPIQHAIGELTTGSSEVSAASAQVEAASQQLAEGTTEQAASIQETSSTLEETASMVQQNNENTRQAAIMAKSAKDYAEKSNSEMSQMMVSMEDLMQSSNEIAKIIKVIDEIAFQTNILSLNAAVEAARAGDAGKGFAVVAEEVRNLAQRSAQAAKDTASIIENNISLSETSVEMAKTVNDALSSIGNEAKKVSELLEEISTATEEQSRGVGEINKAIRQMEQVMQSNSATAEQSAAASRQLSSQAVNVNEIVQVLTRLVEGSDAVNINRQLSTSQIRTTQRRRLVTANQTPESVIPLNTF